MNEVMYIFYCAILCLVEIIEAQMENNIRKLRSSHHIRFIYTNIHYFVATFIAGCTVNKADVRAGPNFGTNVTFWFRSN